MSELVFGILNAASAVLAVFLGWHYVALLPAAIAGALLFAAAMQAGEAR